MLNASFLSLKITILGIKLIGCDGGSEVGKVGIKGIILSLTLCVVLGSKIISLEGTCFFLPKIIIFNFIIDSSRLFSFHSLKSLHRVLLIMVIEYVVELQRFHDPNPTCILQSSLRFLFFPSS